MPAELISSITVLDNASDEWNRDLLSHHDFGALPVRRFYSSENCGFGAVVNFAVAQVDAAPEDIIWILNPDMILERSAAQILFHALETNLAEIISPVITTGAGGELIWYAGGDFDLDRGCTSHRKALPVDKDNNYSAVSFMTGAAPMLRLKDWLRLGGFRSDLFLYWEDADWSLRASALGFRMAVVHEAIVWHKVGGSSSDSGKSSAWYYHMHRNRLVVCGEYRSKISLVLGSGFTYTLRLIVRALRERSGIGEKLAASFTGMWNGLTARPLPTRRVTIVP